MKNLLERNLKGICGCIDASNQVLRNLSILNGQVEKEEEKEEDRNEKKIKSFLR